MGNQEISKQIHSQAEVTRILFYIEIRWKFINHLKVALYILWMSFVPEAYLGPYQALNIMFIDLWCNFLEKILHDQKLLTIFAKNFITDVW